MKINGMAAALSMLQNMPTKASERIQEAIDKTANKIVQEASAQAPGSLANGISATPGNLSSLIDGGSELAAYIEWGTGDFAKAYVATLPKEQQEEALRFFVTGKGHGRPQPFFFPAIMRNTPELLEAIEKELQKLAE